MSWIKNVFNKLIGDEPEYKEQTNNVHKESQDIVEDDQFEEHEAIDLPSEQLEQQPTEKKDFKFPMYYDEKKMTHEVPVVDEFSPVTEVENMDERPLILKKAVDSQLQKNQYSPFASQQQVGRPIADTGRESYKPFANSGVAPKKPKPVELPKTPKKKIPSFEERKRDVKEIVQVKPSVEAPPKKKFVPTDVPSPVYGFQKKAERTAYERKVNDLLVEERKRHKGTIADQLVQQRLQKENRLANPLKHEVKSELAIEKEVRSEEPIFERKTIVPKDIKPTDIVVEKFSFDLSDVVTEIEVPEIEVEVPELKVEVPEIEVEVPELKVEVPEIEVEVPELKVEVPEIKVEVQEIEVEVPEIEVEVQEIEVEVPEIEVEVPEINVVVQTPEQDVQSTATVEQHHTIIKEAEAIVEAAVEAKKLKEDLTTSNDEFNLTTITESQNSEENQEVPGEATLIEEVSSSEEEAIIVQTEEVAATTTRISKTPINVVMLKSDKAKLKVNEATNEQSLKITFPEWKKNPLKVMQSYGQINQPSEKATAHKAVEEVHPTAGKSQQFIEEISKDAVLEEQIVDAEIHEELLSEDLATEKDSLLQEVEAVQEESALDKVDSFIPDDVLPTINEDDFKPELIEVVEEKRPTAWDSYKPSLALLREPVEEQQDYEWMESQGELLKEVLAEFNIPAEIVQIFQGPTVTQFEITVGHGVKISKIRNLSDNFKLALAAREIRIEAPIPGKRTIGIEIPNANARPVRLSEIVGNSTFEQSTNQLEVALGLDLTGQPVTFNLNDMPHGLIAGSTGSGKSVCINSILMSLIMKASPNDVKLMLIDPKMVELAVYDELPHLVSPVITDVKAATAALKWAVEEMERRYQLFHHMKVRHISRYNEIVEEQRRFSLKMPYLVIVIDELADLMMMAPSEVEESICRIAQKARACGIHLVLATQRPSVDVITGLIKSNIPTRIAFAVSSQIDSRTILDSQGAERLLGKGDMLYLASGKSAASRLQGTFVTDEEIEDVTSYIRTLGKPNYSFAPEELVHKVEREEEQDDLFEEACRHVADEGSVSISALQRKYRIGYNRAARLVEMMDAQGFVSEARGTKPRDVFLTPEKVEEIFS